METHKILTGKERLNLKCFQLHVPAAIEFKLGTERRSVDLRMRGHVDIIPCVFLEARSPLLLKFSK